MTAASLIQDARRQGIELFAAANGKLGWRCQGPLPDGLRAMLVANKAALLPLLDGTASATVASDGPAEAADVPVEADVPAATDAHSAEAWDQARGDTFISHAMAVHRRRGWPDDDEGCRHRGELVNAIDAAYLRRDLTELREAVEALLDDTRGEPADAALPAATPSAVEPWRPMPPPGAKLFCQRADASICGPDDTDLYLWTWEGAPSWFYAAEHPVPSGR